MKTSTFYISSILAIALALTMTVASADAATATPQGLWDTSVTPSCIADGSSPCNITDENSVELGVKFQTSKPILINGVRFYRADSGEWSGSLWDANGTLITSAPDSTGGAGWQTANFSSPAPMGIGDTFVASYFAFNGGYAFEHLYFNNALTVEPVTSLGDGVNGLFTYSSNSAFPTDTFRNSNYWVTPLWTPHYTIQGFYQPIEMSVSNDVYNTVKSGSTVPLKFQVFWGDVEQTNISVVDKFEITNITCPSSSSLIANPVEALITTGNTTLRYDTTAGQFIQNWKTPKNPGACYQVKLLTSDGSSISAFFKLN